MIKIYITPKEQEILNNPFLNKPEYLINFYKTRKSLSSINLELVYLNKYSIPTFYRFYNILKHLKLNSIALHCIFWYPIKKYVIYDNNCKTEKWLNNYKIISYISAYGYIIY